MQNRNPKYRFFGAQIQFVISIKFFFVKKDTFSLLRHFFVLIEQKYNNSLRATGGKSPLRTAVFDSGDLFPWAKLFLFWFLKHTQSILNLASENEWDSHANTL